MKISLLKLSNFNFSKIGLGCATFGRESDEKSAWAMMDYAVQKKINHFDLAAAYAKGESERIVGRWLASRHLATGSILLATKMLGPFTPEAVRTSVENSLRSLQVEALDIFYFHKWDETAADPNVLSTLEKLIREGKIRTLGASNFNAEQMARIIALQTASGYHCLQALQNNNNFAVRHIDGPMRELCLKNEIVIFTFSALGSGFLTGKHREGVEPGSRFAIVPNNQNIYFTEEAYRRLDQLESLSVQLACPKVTLALLWALHQPNVASVLVGGRTTEQLEQAFQALSLDRPDLLRELAVK